jgi:hypothetical protein
MHGMRASRPPQAGVVKVFLCFCTRDCGLLSYTKKSATGFRSKGTIISALYAHLREDPHLLAYYNVFSRECSGVWSVGISLWGYRDLKWRYRKIDKEKVNNHIVILATTIRKRKKVRRTPDAELHDLYLP